MVIKEVINETHDDLQKKHFARHKNEEGKPIDQMYFSAQKGSGKRHPTTINKRKKGLV